MPFIERILFAVPDAMQNIWNNGRYKRPTVASSLQTRTREGKYLVIQNKIPLLSLIFPLKPWRYNQALKNSHKSNLFYVRRSLFILLLMSSTCFTALGQGWQWAISNSGDTGKNGITTLASDNIGNTVIAGINYETQVLGNFVIPDSANSSQGFIAKVDTAGRYLWAVYTKQDFIPLKVVCDANGSSYLFGVYNSGAGLSFYNSNGEVATLADNYDTTKKGIYFLLKLDNSGNIIWLQNVAPITEYTPLYFHSGDMGIDTSGHLWVTGFYYLHSVTIGSTTLINSSDSTNISPYGVVYRSNIFVAKYDTSGNVLWAKDLSGDDPGGGGQAGITVTKDGTAFLCGFYLNSFINIGATKLTSTSLTYGTFYVARLAANGTILWAKNLIPESEITSVAVDNDGNFYITGTYSGDRLIVGKDIIVGTHYGNFFIAKYNALGNVLWAHSANVTNAYGEFFGGRLAVDDCHNIWVSGMDGDVPSDSIEFGGYVLPVNPNTENIPFFLKYTADGNCEDGFAFLSNGSGDVPLVACDSRGSLYIASAIPRPTLSLGNLTLYNNYSANKFFEAKYTYMTFSDFVDTAAQGDLCAGNYTSLYAPGGYINYMWNNNSNRPYETVTQPGIYTVQCDNICMGKQITDIFTVVDAPCDTCIYMPNAFTPNNDGLNDVILAVVRPWCNISVYSFRIFNRWGEEVFHSNDVSAGWDGRYNGILQNIGTYEYLLTYTNPVGNGKHLLKGDITLIR